MKNIVIRQLEPQDIDVFLELLAVFVQVFEHDDLTLPDEIHLARILAKPDLHIFVALSEERVIGGLTAYTLEQYYSTQPLAYIYDLAVLEEFQRQGVGKSIIAAFRQYCQKQGYEEIFVEAEKEDTQAVNFYRATQAQEMEVAHFFWKLPN
jgi:aminoglycoside 3-N-acetyltransferase I